MRHLTLISVVVLAFNSLGLAAEIVTFRDDRGVVVGTARTSGDLTTFRDGHGRVTGTAAVRGNQTVYRDAKGRYTGTAIGR